MNSPSTRRESSSAFRREIKPPSAGRLESLLISIIPPPLLRQGRRFFFLSFFAIGHIQSLETRQSASKHASEKEDCHAVPFGEKNVFAVPYAFDLRRGRSVTPRRLAKDSLPFAMDDCEGFAAILAPFDRLAHAPQRFVRAKTVQIDPRVGDERRPPYRRFPALEFLRKGAAFSTKSTISQS